MSKNIIFFIFGVLFGVLLATLAPRVVESINGFDSRMNSGYTRIRLGMDFDKVENLMGKPGTKSNEFRLGQPGGYEIEYRAASRSGADFFVFWKHRGDYYYCVAFDKDGKVVYKAEGWT